MLSISSRISSRHWTRSNAPSPSVPLILIRIGARRITESSHESWAAIATTLGLAPGVVALPTQLDNGVKGVSTGNFRLKRHLFASAALVQVEGMANHYRRGNNSSSVHVYVIDGSADHSPRTPAQVPTPPLQTAGRPWFEIQPPRTVTWGALRFSWFGSGRTPASRAKSRSASRLRLGQRRSADRSAPMF